MKRRNDEIGLIAWVSRFARTSPRAGVHLAIRCLGFPHFATLERGLPRSGRVLDVGCGHGLLSILAAARGPEREVLGVDLLEERLRVGREVALRHGLGNVRFERGDAGSYADGPFDAIVVADVLFYRPLEAQRALLARLLTHLVPGGKLLLKEQTREPAWKARLVSAQEALVVGAKVRLGGSKPWAEMATAGFHLWNAAELEATLQGLGLEVSSRPLDRFSYLSHHLFIGRRPMGPLPLQDPRPSLTSASDSPVELPPG